jgi:hypothetical protein
MVRLASRDIVVQSTTCVAAAAAAAKVNGKHAAQAPSSPISFKKGFAVHSQIKRL